MNCQTFATLAPELARGSLVETGARDAARAHADACRPCAARLGDERALAGGLRTLARAGGEAEAPARVEAALLAAFRARDWNGDASRDAATTRAAEVTTGATVRSLRWFPRWAQGAAVAAASALLVFGLYGLFVKRAGVTGGERASAPPQSSSQSQRAEASAHDPEGFASSDEDDAGGESRKTTAAVSPARAHRRAVGARSLDAGFGGGPRAVAGSHPASAGRPLGNTSDERAEITTDFIPLVDAGHAPADSGHLVRVELPRSALARFGLPLNAERAGERVKADVLMGDDGIARAIRFVR